MNSESLAFMSLRQAAELVRTRQVSPVELLDAVLARTERLEPQINAYITRTPEQARARAREAERELVAGTYLGPLHGIPIALKDNYWTQGVRTTAGSKFLADFVPREDSAVVSRLRTAGAVITGKTNMHELAVGGSSINPHYGAVHNPWDSTRVPGGSSGGSAAAVAAGLCYAATGSDTAGSIRQPAAYCNLAGLKPTFGRVSTYGVVPLSWSLDHAGPLARSVADVALVTNVIAGYDPRDPASADVTVPDFTSELGEDLRGVRLGVLRPYFFDRLDTEVRVAVETALDVLRDLGALVTDVCFPSAAQAVVLYPFVSRPEAASFQEQFLRSRPDDYGPDVRLSIELGEVILATDYLRAQRLRTALRAELETVLRDVDAVLTPTTRTVAPPISQPFDQVQGEAITPFDLYVGLTVPFDLTGSPALSVPCGASPGGLAIGLQIIGRAWDEQMVLRVGAAYESATPWHRRHP